MLGRYDATYQESLEGPVRLYFDFESYYPTEEEQRAKDGPTLRSIIAMIKDKTGAERISILKACGRKPLASPQFLPSGQWHAGEAKWINSYHIILLEERFVFDCGASARLYIKSFFPADFEPQYDAECYRRLGARQLFRAPLQVKGGYDRYRPLLPHIMGQRDMTRKQAWSYLFGYQAKGRIEDYLITAYDSKTDSLMRPGELNYRYRHEEPMKPLEAQHDFDDAIELLSQQYPTELINHDFDTKPKGIFLYGKRVEVSKCIICQVTHNRDGHMVLVDGEDAVIYTCTNRKRHPGAKAIVLKQKKKRMPGDALRRVLAAPEVKAAGAPSPCGAGPTVLFDHKYLSDAPEVAVAMSDESAANIICIRSPMGSGKSVAISKIICDPRTPMRCVRVAVLTMRISLSMKCQADYPGFEHYQGCAKDGKKGAKAPITAPRIICVMDSLWRVDLNESYDIIVLDEAEAIISHLSSGTFMKQPMLATSIAKLKNMLGRARKIVLMDANMSAHTISAVKSLRADIFAFNRDGSRYAPPMETVILVNTHAAASRDIHLTHCRFTIIHDATAALADGKRVYLAMNYSAEKTALIAKSIADGATRIRGHAPAPAPIKMLVITRLTLSDEAVKAALDNPRGTWGQYDFIVASPSIQSGISYDLPGFDCVFGIFNNLTNSCSDMIQQLSRIRHPSDNVIRVSLKHHNNTRAAAIVTEQDLLDNIVARHAGVSAAKAVDSGIFGHSYDLQGLMTITNTSYYRLYRDNTLRANADLRGFESNWVRIARECGHRPMAYGALRIAKADEDEVKVCLIDLTKQYEQSEDKALSAAANITPDQAKELDIRLRSGVLDHKDTLSARIHLHRHHLMRTYDMPHDAALTADWFIAFKDNGELFHNLRTYRRDFEEGLKDILDRELRDDAFNCVIYHCGDPVAAAPAESIIAHLTQRRTRHDRHKLVLDWLRICGITSLIDGKTDKKTVLMSLGTLTADIKNTAHLLGKRPNQASKILSLDIASPTAYRAISKFIMPALEADFGVSMRVDGRRSNTVVLSNEFASMLEARPFGAMTPSLEPQPIVAA
jgi:hypothetical protein